MIPVASFGEARTPRHTLRPLSPLEQAIIELAGEGMSAREIAFYLSLDARLVKKRLHTIFGPPRAERPLPARTT
jgi:DNA-binding NarL/FixJ family response regulator